MCCSAANRLSGVADGWDRVILVFESEFYTDVYGE
jgi:hypothetical protein